MTAVFEAVGDVFEAVGDVVGDVFEGVIDVVDTVMEEVVAPVMDTVSNVVEAAMDDPIGTAAKVATAIYAPYLLPLTNAAVTIANGGDLQDGLEAAALTYVAQGVGSYVNAGADMAFAENFSPESIQAITDPISGEVTNQIVKGSVADIAGNLTGGVASGIVRGQDPLDALLAGSIGTATNLLSQEIPGFSEMPEGVQQSVRGAISAKLQGGDPTNALLNAALNAGIAAVKGNQAEPEAKADEEQEVVSEDGIAGPRFDEFSGMPVNSGLTSLETSPVSDSDNDGLASLVDNEDGTFSQKLSDGSEIIEDQNGNFIGVKDATEVAFEDQATTPTEKTQDEMTPEDWAALYATPTTNPDTGETIVGADPSMYNVQDLGLGEKVDFGAYDNPSLGWTPNSDGSLTYTYDDGSTITSDEDGNVLGVTESTDTPYTPGVSPVKTTGGSGSGGVNLGLIGGALVGGAMIGGGRGGGGRGGGGGGTDNAGEESQEELAARGLRFDWNQQGVNSLVDGKAYGQRFFDPRFEEIPAAKGGLMSLAAGGPTNQRYNLGSYSDGGRMLRGPGDGMSDNIPATIANKQPARLADGEFVIPADVVSHLGNGSSAAGSKVLYAMMEKVRRARTGNAKQGKKINPNKFVPK